jgi:hypothetical protein
MACFLGQRVSHFLGSADSGNLAFPVPYLFVGTNHRPSILADMGCAASWGHILHPEIIARGI